MRIILILFLLSTTVAHAQFPWDPRPKGDGIAGFTSYSKGWKIIQESGTIHGTVIQFNRELRGCGDVVSSAVAILKRKNDTLRVIMTCFDKRLSAGQDITIKVEKWQPGFGPGLPIDDEYFMEQRKKGLYLYRVNEYDEIVAKTIFGRPIDR